MAVTTESASAAPTSQEALHSLLCKILPPQGAWSDDAYLWLTDHSNRLIEFTDGHVQELPMLTFTHQAVLLFLYDLFRAYLKPRGGVVMVAALTLRGGQYVEDGVYARGGVATSPLLAGFTAEVSAVFDSPDAGA